MLQRRKFSRTRISKRSRIFLSPDHSLLDCLVIDISVAGARLESPAREPIPDTFELTFDAIIMRPCRVAWRSSSELGVAFTNVIQSDP
jgi:hypothetical protein